MFRSLSVNTCLLHATADSAWLSKQLKNRSSCPRASKVADRGKHAYPDSELQIAENTLEGGASLGSQCIALSSS